ncbi:MAG: diacylglycerol kinase [Treponema sp.]|nr:diacylglycerol kinase [Treponema sp.]
MNYVFAQAISEICEHSLVCLERPLRCLIIMNPVAGGFYFKSKWEANVKILEEYREKARKNPRRQLYKNVIVSITEGKGSASEITKGFIERSVKDAVPFYLIISGGGDGTHREVMNSLYNAPAHILRTMAVLRLPMGTGNDGSDSNQLSKALDLLLKPTCIELAPAVQLIPNKNGPANWKGPFYAYNICSVGLDAYVTHMTNEKKGKATGDAYKFWVDMATLSYHKKYKVDFFDVKGLDKNNKETMSFKEKLLLLAMGVSGGRTYGSQQNILPDSRNVCGIKNISFLSKLKIKRQVAGGNHIKNKNVIIFDAHRLEFTCRHQILAQMDGETVLLQPEDFPAVMELTEAKIPLLKPDLEKKINK